MAFIKKWTQRDMFVNYHQSLPFNMSREDQSANETRRISFADPQKLKQDVQALTFTDNPIHTGNTK